MERDSGRGAAAPLRLARDLTHGHPFALRLVRPAMPAVADAAGLRPDAGVAPRLSQSRILCVHEPGDTEGPLWYTLREVSGESLRDRLAREGRFPLDEALRIAAEAGRALHFAHREGVVHGDLRPENVLLTLDGDTVVADFGAGRPEGAPAYLAPEQATDGLDVDARSDQYSLAVVCWEMLTGRPPFAGASAAAILAQRLAEPAPSVRAHRADVSESADLALRRALSLDPAERFDSILELVGALAVPGPAPASTPPALPPRRPPSRLRALRPWLLLGGLALLGGTVMALV